MSENCSLIAQAEYARHRNNSPQYIGKLYDVGILVTRARRVGLAATDAVLEDKPVERAAPDGQAPWNYAQERLADMVFRVRLRRLEFHILQGKLIEAAEVKER